MENGTVTVETFTEPEKFDPSISMTDVNFHKNMNA